jgi:hypothetical protein
LTDAKRIEVAARALLRDAAEKEPDERLADWHAVFPIVCRGCPALVTELIVALPDVLRAVQRGPDPVAWRAMPMRLFGYAVEHVAGLRDAELFPPLVEAGVALARWMDQAPHYSALDQITWPCLRWFRALDCTADTQRFLHETRKLWPAALPAADRPYNVLIAEVCAYLAHEAALAQMTNNSNQLSDNLAAVRDTIRVRRQNQPLTNHEEVRLAISFARAAALLPADGACERISKWVDELPPIPNRWTTAQHYSRFHLEFVDAVVLAFPRVGDF